MLIIEGIHSYAQYAFYPIMELSSSGFFSRYPVNRR